MTTFNYAFPTAGNASRQGTETVGLEKVIALTGINVVEHPESLLRMEDIDDNDMSLAQTLNGLRRGGLQTLLVIFTGTPARCTLSERRQKLERIAFDSGWRKHPNYYLCVDYEALHHDACPQMVALEKVPDAAWASWPMDKLKAERDLHMDMTREAGERSDGHVIRYQLAAELILPGDVVLDAACGLGYGSHLLARQSQASLVIGVDGSEYAVSYARENFGAVEPRLRFQNACLPHGLADLPDFSVDVVVSFETLEHIEDPAGLLAAFARVLRPGGRIMVSVPNDWSDETGEDPNPHHLHVYTLDSLSRQFARHFQRQGLWQQIASGCKALHRGLAWTPYPRALRRLPAETALAPDSEWWVMSGVQPGASTSTASDRGLEADWYRNREPRWASLPQGTATLARGLVLAMHCIPASVDPSVERFWSEVTAAMADRGMTLVLLSTTAVNDPTLNVIEIPFELTAYPDRFTAQPAIERPVLEADLLDIARWYRCDASTAARSWRVAHAFFEDLITTLRPSAVVGWQSQNPVSRVLRQTSRETDIPFWSAERGWLKGTLMLDTGENNRLSESQVSFGLRRARQRYRASEALLQRLSQRAESTDNLDRYKGPEVNSSVVLRNRLGIGPDDCVVSFFNHGEPALHALSRGTLRDINDTDPERIATRLAAVAQALHARGAWLLVQEHPFNQHASQKVALPELPRVRRVQENAGSLLRASNASLFTSATLQFDTAFLDRPFGLLSRSVLFDDGVPPFIEDFPDAYRFVDHLLDSTTWATTQPRLREHIAFLYEHLLLDIDDAHIGSSALEWAGHFEAIARPVDAAMDARVERFLNHWTS